MKPLEILLVITSTLFVILTLALLFDAYMDFRFRKIMDYLCENAHADYNPKKVIDALQRFWVWPISRFFE